jgi:hypothetical protein
VRIWRESFFIQRSSLQETWGRILSHSRILSKGEIGEDLERILSHSRILSAGDMGRILYLSHKIEILDEHN